jgi:hypothetical protein
MKPTIELCPDEGEIYLIYLCESGVEYMAQADGIACAHPTAEGVLIPLFNEHYGLLDLSEFCCMGENPENEMYHPEINKAIAHAQFELNFGYKMTVDPLSLHPIYEAWVPVTLERVKGCDSVLDMLHGFPDKFQGILVYQNCD